MSASVYSMSTIQLEGHSNIKYKYWYCRATLKLKIVTVWAWNLTLLRSPKFIVKLLAQLVIHFCGGGGYNVFSNIICATVLYYLRECKPKSKSLDSFLVVSMYCFQNNSWHSLLVQMTCGWYYSHKTKKIVYTVRLVLNMKALKPLRSKKQFCAKFNDLKTYNLLT